ncbi:Alpha/Beta hydrolase protein [Sphaerosporella brunnea]|uniref:Alpha/Beta hydrolase protein n=1 Tax=Sphaerosporella brunnea TaxID=1250544 RepID=A0A5J5EVU3_9PEZI|nr:Alpha/Beta hydrolase protein [Sphaerosporella brunnea]
MSHEFPARFKATIPVRSFTVSFTDDEVHNMTALVKLSKLARPTYEGQSRNFGLTSEWMKLAKATWENDYDWRTTEARINSLPQYLATIGDQTIHFVGIFSEDPDAVPLLLLHGWPGSFFEFYPLIDELKKSTQPSFHIVAPSFPGYMFSSPPPLQKDFRQIDAAHIIDELMIGLGLGPYIAVGGNMGAQAARALTARERCRGCHLSMFLPHATPCGPEDELPEHEIAGLARGREWLANSRAYLMLHGTRPSTIAHLVSSSPIALLAWIGEKFMDWTDEDPPVEFVLEMASLWWLTECYPTTVYPYREFMNMTDEWKELWRIKKPFGFSWFPKEVVPQPRSWIAGEGDLIFFNTHKTGGHFPAFEKPVEFSRDIVGFVEALTEREKQ